MDLKVLVVMLMTFACSSAVIRVIKKNSPLVFRSFNDIKVTKLLESGHPKFCKDLDCPVFKTIKKEKGYDLRLYEESNWVTTAMTGISWDAVSGEMFEKLFHYIEGENEKKTKVAMTAPVITRIIPGEGPACKNNFTMSFYVAVQPAPKPTNKDVMFTSLPKQEVYVGSFGGWPSQEQWITHAATLAKSIGNDTLYKKGYYYGAGYNSPFDIFNRHNEIWFIAK